MAFSHVRNPITPRLQCTAFSPSGGANTAPCSASKHDQLEGIIAIGHSPSPNAMLASSFLFLMSFMLVEKFGEIEFCPKIGFASEAFFPGSLEIYSPPRPQKGEER